MKNFLISIPASVEARKIKDFRLSWNYFILNSEEFQHRLDLGSSSYYTFSILKKAILVTIFEEDNII